VSPHEWDHGVAHAHRADHVHHQERGSRLGGHCLEANRVRLIEPPGGVHEHVDPSARLVRPRHKPVNRILIGDIELGGAGRAACGHDLSCDRFGRRL
jgi:hypothetical protein